MSIKKTKFKIELTLVCCFAFLFFRALPAVKQETDEPVESHELVVEYATGTDSLLNKGTYVMKIPTPTLLPPSSTPIPFPTQIPGRSIQVAKLIGTKYTMENLRNLNYLKDNFYIVNSTTKMTEADFDAEYFIEKDLSIQKKEEPQILIFHTHGSEAFLNSRAGMQEDTVIGVGSLLSDVLEQKYGYQVLHDTTVFDKKNGKDNRNYAYNDAIDYLEKLLRENPSIEVVIDLHRDAGAKRVVEVNGKPTAKVMLFNGLCRNTKGKLAYLPNENLKDNLAFSFQMKLIGDEMYPGLMNRIFLKDYRYNMHLAERYLLIELGTEQNTVEEAKNAMEPLADVLAQVLGGN